MMGALGNYSLLFERKRKKHTVKVKGRHKKHCPLSTGAREELAESDSRHNVK